MNCFLSFSFDFLLCGDENAFAHKVELCASCKEIRGRAQHGRGRDDDILGRMTGKFSDRREAARLTDDAHGTVAVAFCKQFADGDLLLQPAALSASCIDDGLFHKYLRS